MNGTLSDLPLQQHQIKTDSDSLSFYAKDWTTYFDIRASAIVFPESTTDVVSIVNWARNHKVGLVPSGGRTGLSGAACALNGEVVVSFERMNKIIHYIGLDVHKESVAVSIAPGDSTEVRHYGAIGGRLEDLDKVIKKLEAPEVELRFCRSANALQRVSQIQPQHDAVSINRQRARKHFHCLSVPMLVAQQNPQVVQRLPRLPQFQ